MNLESLDLHLYPLLVQEDHAVHLVQFQDQNLGLVQDQDRGHLSLDQDLPKAVAELRVNQLRIRIKVLRYVYATITLHIKQKITIYKVNLWM